MSAARGMKVHGALAEAFYAEGVRAQFGLMGDANMLWMLDLAEREAVSTYHVRHEHCAVGMAMGYHSATGRVGVASVTCGPGFTQIMTALSTAVRARIPLIVCAGEAPLSVRGYGQGIDQPPFAAACGAHYVAMHVPEALQACVNEAFHHAQAFRTPIVLGVPVDVQKMDAAETPYRPVSGLIPVLPPAEPDAPTVEYLAERLYRAERPLIVAGRGAVRAGCGPLLRELAEAGDALLANTLLARGLFDDDELSLGVVGGYASVTAERLARQADLVLAFGASLSSHTTNSGKLFAAAEVVQVDIAPVGWRAGRQVADRYVRADCRLTATAVLARLREMGAKAGKNRTPDRAAMLAAGDEKPAFAIASGEVDPREAFAVLAREIPHDFDIVSGSAHQAYWHAAEMRGGDPERYHAIRDFGAIGNSLSIAVGVAAARGNGRVVLFEGDGSLMMHIQELDTLQREGVKLLIVCCNDGAYGGESHTLKAEGRDPSSAIFGRPDFAGIARAFGLRGATIRNVAELDGLLAEYEAGDSAMIWDMHVSLNVTTPRKARQVRALADGEGVAAH